MQHPGLNSCIVTEKNVKLSCTVKSLYFTMAEPKRCYLVSGYQVTFITARKRSFGQGDVFIPVCHSVHRGGVGSASQESLHLRRSASGGRDWVDPFLIRYYSMRLTSGRYASYWNAFLCFNSTSEIFSDIVRQSSFKH